MSLGKLPVIGWVSSSHGKRRLKSELTPDMISPPQGDFRHTMHVGRGGDVFGDTSFLSNHGGEPAKANNFFARTLRHVRRTPLRNRGSGGKTEASPAPPAISPIIKNAVSLPQLNEGSYRGGGFAGKPAGSSLLSLSGLESGFCTIPRAPCSEKSQDNTFSTEPELKRSDSLLSFRLDLGPSLMSELLHVISFTEDLNLGDRREEREEGTTPTRSTPGLPLQMHGAWAEDEIPWTPATPHARYEEDSKVASNFWSHSEASSPSEGSACTNGDAHSLQGAEEGLTYARGGTRRSGWGAAPAEGALPKETLWQGHWNDCTMETGEFNRATQVLARHYSRGATHHSQEEEEEEEEARTRSPWESPDSSIEHSERQAHEAAWYRGEEEEEETEEFSGERGAVANEGRSDSFEYADEEDDEIKV
uniref:CDC42 effector protein 1 n=1 Tax=Sphenodon punctatus TaxID=8508 RepID=A0A8D0H6R1_SPHPU